ncbi:MAG: hypothetical protein ACHQ1G_10715 [Planctomycetota bacterium]
MTAPTLFVGRHFRHHALRSGYAELATHIDPDARVIPGFRWIPRPLARPLARRAGIGMYGIDGIRAEAAAILSMLVRKGRLYHFVYGESHYRYAGRFAARRGHRILCTFHQPPEVLARVLPSRDHLKALAGIIVVARCQVPFFTELLGPERVFFVPHGIDTSFFRPPEVRPATRTCLCVGHWLRDFGMLKEAVAILRQGDPALRVEIVSAGESEGLLGTEGVTFANRVPTPELIARRASGTLPLAELGPIDLDEPVSRALRLRGRGRGHDARIIATCLDASVGGT